MNYFALGIGFFGASIVVMSPTFGRAFYRIHALLLPLPEPFFVRLYSGFFAVGGTILMYGMMA